MASFTQTHLLSCLVLVIVGQLLGLIVSLSPNKAKRAEIPGAMGIYDCLNVEWWLGLPVSVAINHYAPIKLMMVWFWLND